MAEQHSSLSRRHFLTSVGLGVAGLGAGSLLVACSDDSGVGSSAAGNADSGSTDDGKTRTFTDDAGREVTIPAHPQRLVSTKGITSLVALGITPVGIANMEIDLYPYPDVLEQLRKDDVTDLNERELNIEKVMSLQPDVIVAATPRDDDNRETLAAIAPTLVIDSGDERKHRWDDTLRFFARVMDKEDKAEELLDAYHERVEAFRKKHGEYLKDKTVSVLRIRNDNLIIYTKSSFAGGVLEDVGIRRPHNQDLDLAATKAATNGESIEAFPLSPERLKEADADIMFVVVQVHENPSEHDDKDKATLAHVEQVKNHPLWSQLEAVKNNQTFFVNAVWNGESVMEANSMLDDLDTHIGALDT
ncbi:putative siderophore-binding lipoprotein YfiY precursor [Corynebacterium ciconiae DSM 44920]|uniref:ABC transporter substrate-binding protein n=1 Tax=Corynebacterium ciconiae TaxID=227319 RepID=UPI00037EA657|nr:iron-siderophore ABC transporter substrate-binding protein [Corynebacterium ciconiae]WKD62146.1 putative siderophore-binding lipoprotein YfiY precursor [Corynebacterium ciconiae DSM 44920]